MQTLKKVTLIVMIGLVAGCSQIGQGFEYEHGTRIDQNLYSRITSQGLSKESILSLTGQPQKRKAYKGREIWLFEYKKSSTVPMTQQPIIFERVILDFDKNGALSRHRRKSSQSDPL